VLRSLESGCHAGEEVVDVPAQIGGYISFEGQTGARTRSSRPGQTRRSTQSCRSTNPRQATVAIVLHQPLIETEFSFHPGPAQAAYAPLSTRFSVISKSRPLHTAAFPMSLAGCPPIASPRRGPRARSSYSAVSHTSRKVRKLHRSGQPWMGPSIVPKLAIAPVFTAFTVCAVIISAWLSPARERSR
jgi:hypothetical protein